MFQNELFRAIRYFGKQQKRLAQAIDVKPSAVSNWVNGVTRTISLKNVLEIERVTLGTVKAEDLAPDKKELIDYLRDFAYLPYKVRLCDIKIDNISRAGLDNIADLAADIQAYDLKRAIAISTDNQLLFGLRRVHACAKLGWDSIVAHRIDLQAFIKLESKDYGIIVRCRLSERAALGFALEPLLVSLKAQHQHWHMAPIVKQWRVHRPEINISACNAEQLAAKLLYFDSVEVYRTMKYVINRAKSIVVEAIDLGNISPDQAVGLADLPYGEQANALQELLVKCEVA